jgi:hypothetical protein
MSAPATARMDAPTQPTAVVSSLGLLSLLITLVLVLLLGTGAL